MSNARTHNPHLTAFAAAAGSRAGGGLLMSATGRPERELLPLGGTARSAKGAPVTTWLPTGVVGHDPHRLDRGISR